MKVIFLGNHTVGVSALKAIMATTELVGIVAHPLDPEDGVVYESVYQFAIDNDIKVIRCKGRDEVLYHFIKDLEPDLIWITDYRYIIPDTIFNLVPFGAVNIHPSLLPKYRGRAALNWALINGETEFGITAHFVDEGVDTGDIIKQLKFNITTKEDIGDVLNLCYPLYYQLTVEVLQLFLHNNIKRVSQPKEGKIYGRRRPKDGLIDWNKNTVQIFNLIRAVAKPYPGAFSYLNGRKIKIWKAEIVALNISEVAAGTICSIEENQIEVRCKDGILLLKDIELEKPLTILPQMKFSSETA